jgi:hypothetical protein
VEGRSGGSGASGGRVGRDNGRLGRMWGVERRGVVEEGRRHDQASRRLAPTYITRRSTGILVRLVRRWTCAYVCVWRGRGRAYIPSLTANVVGRRLSGSVSLEEGRGS